jgi:hypothetical protein
LTFAQADALRIVHGKPRYGVDFSEAHLVQETRLMHAVHFQKGCYLGRRSSRGCPAASGIAAAAAADCRHRRGAA